jgi:endo-1,4-beta-xylanase
MTNPDRKHGRHTMNRRIFLQSLSATMAGITATAVAQPPLVQPSSVASLKLAAQRSGKILGMYTVQYQLLHDAQAAAMIAEGFSLIADGNDLKFSDRLRPSPDTFDFSFGDTPVNWAQQHHLLFRGHCLIWWNGLPKWFNSYVNQKNAKQVMTKHISTVVKHYAGRVYSWDVVNECIHNDGRPDGLRRKPWVDLLGPQYIDIAFHTAADADPKARLVLNECYVEHNTPNEIGRRQALLALATRLKKAGVPITTIGLQSHLRGATALDGPGLTQFMKQIQDLGLDIMVTELDVDDVGVPEPQVAQAIADKYNQYLDIVAPYVRVITFEGLQDDPAAPHTHNLFLHDKNASGSEYAKARAFGAALTAIQRPAGSR